MIVRLELFANRSVQDDLFERLEKENLVKNFSLIPETQGVGNNGPRRGDHIWPEENFVLIAYMEMDEAKRVGAIVDDLREFFPSEGITVFATPTVEL